MIGTTLFPIRVVPLVGTWIETGSYKSVSAILTSFPSWERGLKHWSILYMLLSNQSFPSWERGLKPGILVPLSSPCPVVPLVGTWIETLLNAFCLSCWFVVPLVGTWIETAAPTGTPPRRSVVPLVGTWIETSRKA